MIVNIGHRKPFTPFKCEQDGTVKMNQYHLCVDEIKNEGIVLGSLEMHEEAMRRLNQRLGKDRAPSPRVSGEKRVKNVPHSLRENQASPFWKENVFTRFMVSGGRGHDASDPSKAKMAGRRKSAFKPMEFDEGVTAAQMLQDLDLPDSDDESLGPATLSPGEMAKIGGNIGGLRSSFIRRGSATIGLQLRSSMTRFSKHRPSLSIDGAGQVLASKTVSGTPYDYDEREEMKNEKPSMHDGEQGEKSDKKPMVSWVPRRLNHETTGGRRPSRFSVTEKTSVNRSSGSTLICSFRSRDSLTGSYIEDGALICDWERRQSKLSDASVPSVQEGLRNGKEEEAPGSLICGWD